ncbi:MAG: FAD-dependent pyridine nucleotide-disulfide oxidoreductase, partial [Bryobacterales bacterium]|nr:FAD-dependent pyridine nucleotide-disulfide oxidoreductase [Bryobacterales bacterium]
HIAGLVAWLVWLFVHLLYLVEFQNRLLVLIEWAYNYFTHNRGARLITGEPRDDVRSIAPEPVQPKNQRVG